MSKASSMKAFVLVVFSCLPILGFGRCQVSNLFPPNPVIPDAGGAVTTIANNQWAGSEYCQVITLVDNHVYEFIHENGAYITIREGAVGGSVLAMGYSPLSYTTTSTSDLYVHYTADDLCTEESTGAYLTTIQDLGTPACDMSGQGGQHPLSTISPDPGGAITTIANDLTGGSEFSVLGNIQDGHGYQIEHAGGAYVSVRRGAVDGPPIAVGPTPIFVTANSTDDLYINWSQDSDCTPDFTGSFLATVQDQGLAPCDMSGFGGQYPFTSITPDPGGAVTTIATDQFTGSEYSVITGVLAGHTYEFVHAAGSFITVRSGAIAGPVLASGYSPLTVPVVVVEELFVHWSVDEFCNELGSPGGFHLTSVQDQGESCPLSATLFSSIDTICDGEDVTLSISFGGNNGSVDFVVSNGLGFNAVFDDVSTSPFTFTTTESGTYTILSATDDDCEGSVSGTAIVVVNLIPTATLSGGGITCDELPVDIQLDFTGEAPWVFDLLNVQQPGDTTFFLAIQTSSNPHIITIDSVSHGMWGARLLYDDNCFAEGDLTQFVDVEIRDSVTIELGFDQGYICAGDTAMLRITLEGQGPWDVVLTDFDGGTISLPGIVNSPYFHPVTGTETMCFSVESVQGALCTGHVANPSAGSACIQVRARPTATFGSDIFNCTGSAEPLIIDLTGPLFVSFVLYETDSTGAILSTDTIVTGAGQYSHLVSSENSFWSIGSLQDTYCTGESEDTAQVSIQFPLFANISGTDTICPGESAEVTITVGGGLPPYDIVLANSITGNQTPITMSGNTHSFTVTEAASFGLVSATSEICSGEVSGNAIITEASAVSGVLSGGGVSCDGSPLPVQIDLSGDAPWSFGVYSDTLGTVDTVFTNVTSSPVTFMVDHSAQLSMTGVQGLYCQGPGSGEVSVHIENLTAQLSGGDSICEGETTFLTVSFTGDGPFNITLNNELGTYAPFTAVDGPLIIPITESGEYGISALSNAQCFEGTTSGIATVVVSSTPTATLSEGGIICDSTTFLAEVTFEGDGPWNITLDTVGATSPSSLEMSFTEITTNPYYVPIIASGNYHITNISNPLCNGTATGTAEVVFADSTVAAFDWDPFVGTHVINFTDQSANATSWSWNFDGLGTSNDQNPSFGFPGPGIYDVTLAATGPCGTENVTIPVVVAPANDDPCHAVELDAGQNGPYPNDYATPQLSEANPPVGSRPNPNESTDGWSDGDADVQNSIWFTYVVPDSTCGVRITTSGSTLNTQLAVYSALACEDLLLGGWTLLGANDDLSQNDLSSVVTLCDVGPGEVLYIQVDGSSGASGNVNVNIEAPTFVPGFFGDPAGAQFGVEFYNNSIPLEGAVSVSWDFGDGSTDVGSPVFHDYGVEGTFYVCQTVFNTLGCEKTICDSVAVYDPSGILDRSDEVGIFPNPSNGQITIAYGERSGNVKTSLLDIAGRELSNRQIELSNNRQEVRLDFSLPPGTYLLQMEFDEGVITKRIQIQSNN